MYSNFPKMDMASVESETAFSEKERQNIAEQTINAVQKMS